MQSSGSVPCLSLFCISALLHVFSSTVASESIDFQAEASRLQPWLVETRRALHEKPELMYEEVETSKYIRNALDELKITYRYVMLSTG